jgi:type IV pilus assembly protein PilX
MLAQRPRSPGPGRLRQQGIALMMALIVLVAMTLAGIALMRSVDTTSIIAGNLAFQQSATHSADLGTETALTWLQTNNNPALWLHVKAQGYAASRQDPAANQTWDAFWTAVLANPANPQVVTLPQSATTGNTVSYAIQRLCNGTGDPTSPSVDCSVPQSSGSSAGNSKTAGTVALLYNSAIYYRITVRVAGPRNTVSYVQTIVSL